MSYMLVLLGMGSPVVALLLALAIYFSSFRKRSSESSLFGYLGRCVVVAVAFGFFVAAFGRPLCAILQFPEETWGWVIPLFLIPFFTSIAVTVYCIWWLNKNLSVEP